MVSALEKPAVAHTDFNDSLGVHPHINPNVDDLTPSSSPVLRRHNHRQRLVSVSNPEPVIKLMVEGFVRKVERDTDCIERANAMG